MTTVTERERRTMGAWGRGRSWVWLGPLMACLGLCGLLSRSAGADGAQDPQCRPVSHYSAVWAARAKAAMARLPRTGGQPAPKGGKTSSLSIAWNVSLDLPRVTVTGDQGQFLRVDTAPTLDAPTWLPFLTIFTPGAPVPWEDGATAAEATRFYRLTTLTNDPTQFEADNFLLLDSQGVAYELYYPTELSALVVVGVGDSLSGLAPAWEAVRAVAGAYNPTNVQIWAVVSDPAATRASVASAIASAGVTIPVLLDPNGLAVEALGLTHAGEVVVLQPGVFTVSYRGAVGTNAAATALSLAVSNVVAGVTPTLVGTPLTGAALATSSAGTPDYSRDVAPILYQNCAKCHRPDDVAPFAMTNYDVVASWAPVIKANLLGNLMPPWHADPAYGRWANTLELSAADRATLIRWIDAGTPRGSGPDLLATSPVPPSYRSWPAELGPPDAIVTPGVQAVAATGFEPYRYLFVQTPNRTNVWLRAAIILPTAPKVVHHYLVWTGQVGDTGVTGFSTYQSSIAGYVPGVAPYVYPTNSGVPLTASNWITFNLHYTPNGTATNDLPQLALWYWKTPPPKTFHEASAANPLIAIAPYDANSPAQSIFTFPTAGVLQRLNPHMHLRGKNMKFTAAYPNGTSEVLLSVPDYNFLWQNGYELTTPKPMPAGTHILVSGAFDNSAQNLNNPDPSSYVFWGDQTSSEMFVGFIDYTD